MTKQFVAGAQRIVDRDEDIAVMLLECTELSAAAYAVQNAVRLPVYDYTTLIRFIHDASRARRYTGFM